MINKNLQNLETRITSEEEFWKLFKGPQIDEIGNIILDFPSTSNIDGRFETNIRPLGIKFQSVTIIKNIKNIRSSIILSGFELWGIEYSEQIKIQDSIITGNIDYVNFQLLKNIKFQNARISNCSFEEECILGPDIFTDQDIIWGPGNNFQNNNLNKLYNNLMKNEIIEPRQKSEKVHEAAEYIEEKLQAKEEAAIINSIYNNLDQKSHELRPVNNNLEKESLMQTSASNHIHNSEITK